MLKVKKSPGEWSAATGSALVSFCVSVLQEGCCRYRIKYYVHRRVPGSEHPGGSFHQGPSLIIVTALVGLVLFHLCHVLGPCVTFTC